MSHSANTAKSFFRRTQSTRRKLPAWHRWILICAAGAGVTFCLNIALTVWASYTFGLKDGVATIKGGKCNDVKSWDLWLHLGINILSTTLLAASNYTMQCLSAPVREEIDKGHRERITFDIGIPSLRNLRRISRRKLILWGFLAVSSIPLHLVYNSVIFSTLSTHSYTVLVVTSDFLSGIPFGNTTQEEPIYELNSAEVAEIKEIQSNVSASIQDPSKSEWQKISSTQCREAYSAEFLSDRSDVLAVSSTEFSTKSLLHYFTNTAQVEESWNSASWTCTPPFESSMCQNSTADHLQILAYPIDHCLSRMKAEKCQLQFSLPIMIIVIICNLTKAICMLLTPRHRFATPLLTIGDAIDSFLRRPDIYTRNNCLGDKYSFQRRSTVEKRVHPLGSQLKHAVLCKPSLWRFFQQSRLKTCSKFTDDSMNGGELPYLVARQPPLKNHDLLEHQEWREFIRESRFLTSIYFNGQSVQDLIAGEQPLKKDRTSQNDVNSSEHEGWRQTIKECKSKSPFWFSAASTSRWLFYLLLSGAVIIVAGVLLEKFYASPSLEDKSLRNLWRTGYGATLPTLLIRINFYHSNGGFVPMILLANLPQAIISFLYLTYNAIFTCMLVAKEWEILAHKRKPFGVTYPVENQRSTYWLQLPYTYSIPLLVMSSALHWLVSQIIFFVPIEGAESKDVTTACGCSPIAIITVIPVGVILILAIVLTGFRRYEMGMPLAGISSAAISAACQPPGEDIDASLLPVMWGDVNNEDSAVGHCCFTSFEVLPSVEENLYACVDYVRCSEVSDLKKTLQMPRRLEALMASKKLPAAMLSLEIER